MQWWLLLASLATLVLLLAIAHRPLGDYMAWVFTTKKDWALERGVYRVIGADASREQSWVAYLRSVLLFSLVGVLLLFLMLRTQQWLPFAVNDKPLAAWVAINAAISFVTNTDWQSYSGENLGYTAQFAGLTVQNFVSAATGIAVAITLARGFAYRRAGTLGNFWVDLVRAVFRILLPLATLSSLLLIACGVVQNVHGFVEAHTITGLTQQIPGGPVASQEAIKTLGSNGGGFYAANAAHPFENPSGWSNLLQLLLMLLIPFSLPRTFAKIVGDPRQGYAILAVMVTLYVCLTAALAGFEFAGHASAAEAAGAAMEGKEARFGLAQSLLYAASGTSRRRVRSIQRMIHTRPWAGL